MSPAPSTRARLAGRWARSSWTRHVIGLWLALSGCGDDAQSGPSRLDASPTADAAAPDAAARDAATSAIECGGERCPDRSADTPGCCTAEGTGVVGHPLEFTGREAGLCGTDIGSVVDGLSGLCLQLDQPGELDPECPDQVVPSQFAPGDVPPMSGCCTDEGYCGSIELVFPLGCIYATGRKGKPCGSRAGDDAGVIDAG